MKTLDKKLLESLSTKPEFLRSTDLIQLGLFKSFSDICCALKRGLGPPIIRLGERKIIYPKTLLIEWLKGKMANSHKNGRKHANR